MDINSIIIELETKIGYPNPGKFKPKDKHEYMLDLFSIYKSMFPPPRDLTPYPADPEPEPEPEPTPKFELESEFKPDLSFMDKTTLEKFQKLYWKTKPQLLKIKKMNSKMTKMDMILTILEKDSVSIPNLPDVYKKGRRACKSDLEEIIAYLNTHFI